MFTHPEFLLQYTAERQAELRAQADRYRLVTAARWARKQRRAAGRHHKPAPAPDEVGRLAGWAASGAPAR